MAETSSFKVIIAGGGIAGLTLANCLQHADIDYVILEARDVVAPNVGASIGMFSNGGRILDQLGVYDDILAQTEPTKWMSNWKDGKLILRKDAPQLLQARYVYPSGCGTKRGYVYVTFRTGYPITFGDRQMVLQALYDGIRKKSNVLVNKRVASVDHSKKGVTVHCTDGSKYDGDVAIGADGVHSMIRHEMWRIAGITEPGRISKEEKDSESQVMIDSTLLMPQL
jgi:2-polyprenyl-6-methoxyphenol hydroxylase-like FAD-dependent oxidoreductase